MKVHLILRGGNIDPSSSEECECHIVERACGMGYLSVYSVKWALGNVGENSSLGSLPKKPATEVPQRKGSIWVPITSRTLMSDYENTPICSFNSLEFLNKIHLLFFLNPLFPVLLNVTHFFTLNINHDQYYFAIFTNFSRYSTVHIQFTIISLNVTICSSNLPHILIWLFQFFLASYENFQIYIKAKDYAVTQVCQYPDF